MENELAHQWWHITTAPRNTGLKHVYFGRASAQGREREREREMGGCSYDGREMSVIRTVTYTHCVFNWKQAHTQS